MRDDRLAGQVLCRTHAHDQKPPGAELPRGDDRAGIALALQLAEPGQSGQLAPRPAIDFAEAAFECGLAGERHREYVRGHVPRLIGNDPQLHDERPSGLRRPGKPAAERWAPACSAGG
jgi:hypothetical protein